MEQSMSTLIHSTGAMAELVCYGAAFDTVQTDPSFVTSPQLHRRLRAATQHGRTHVHAPAQGAGRGTARTQWGRTGCEVTQCSHIAGRSQCI